MDEVNDERGMTSMSDESPYMVWQQNQRRLKENLGGGGACRF
jgi:hypothetical protein